VASKQKRKHQGLALFASFRIHIIIFVTFSDLLSRCDSEVFQSFIGESCTRLLALLDPKLSSPSLLRRLTIDSIGSHALLQNSSYREKLLPLLRRDEAASLCLQLGIGENSDPYAQLLSIKFPRNSQNEYVLFNFFELPPLDSTNTEVKASETVVSAEYQLFDHQRRASRQVLSLIRTAPHRVLLHMPTGSGKTRTAMNVIANHLRSSEPTVVIWLASSEELCDQAAEEFSEAWCVLGDRPVTLKRFWGSHELNLDGFRDGILIAGLPKLIRLADQDFSKIGLLGTITSLVILDEAHQAIARRYKHVIEALLAHHADSGLIGLSATPGRTWNDVAADEQLAIFFSRRKVNLEIPGYSNPVEYLIEKGYLAKASFSTLLYKSGLKLTDNDLKKLQNALDVPDHILETLAEDEKRNLSIITKVEEMINRHRRIIVFGSSVAHAHLITNVLRARGHDASAITTRTAPQERTRNIDAFKSEKPSPIVLCNYGVLTTGFDAPQTSCAIIARPTKSLVLYSQMVGRAIRGPAAKGNEHADIITVIDQQLPGFGGVADAFSNWEDIWTIPV